MKTNQEQTRGEARLIWRCHLCGHEWDFCAHDQDCIGFMVVYHLAERHQVTREGVLAFDRSLRDAAEEFFGSSAKSQR